MVSLIVLGQYLLRSSGQYLLRAWGQELPEHIVWRLEALKQAYAGHLEYLSELRWFMHSTPLTGHGLNHTPWCGTLGSVGADLNPPVHCTGVPKEAHSDYVLAGLSGVWGMPAALLLTLGLALWLLTLVRPARGRAPAIHSSALAQTTGLCFVAVTLMQLLVTCLGSVGLIPLTGVTFPFLGYGRTSLLVCTVCIGVLLHQPRFNPTENT